MQKAKKLNGKPLNTRAEFLAVSHKSWSLRHIRKWGHNKFHSFLLGIPVSLYHKSKGKVPTQKLNSAIKLDKKPLKNQYKLSRSFPILRTPKLNLQFRIYKEDRPQ